MPLSREMPGYGIRKAWAISAHVRYPLGGPAAEPSGLEPLCLLPHRLVQGEEGHGRSRGSPGRSQAGLLLHPPTLVTDTGVSFTAPGVQPKRRG
jgi:hypothetical protein